MQKLSDLLPSALKRIQLGESSIAALALHNAGEVIQEMWGDSKNIFPEKFVENQLFLRATTDGWRHEFQLRILEFRKKFLQKFTKKKVKKIIIR